MQRYRTLLEAIYRLYEHSGFALAGAMAYSFVVSLFPFCIFLGALAGVFGGRELANEAVAQLFQILPKEVAAGIAPQVESIMGNSRIDLLTASAGLALFFAMTAIETLRTALNAAYRVVEERSYFLCLLRSMLFVLISAATVLILAWAVIVGPVIAAR
ncbi:MAG: YhjD/YihY/BrkB family envelope integrity protein, partial [Hyphomicrobium sp.]